MQSDSTSTTSGRVDYETLRVDLDDLTPEQARLFMKAVVYYRKHFGFEMETLTQLFEMEVPVGEVADTALVLNRLENARALLLRRPTGD